MQQKQTALILRGFPNYEELGNQLKNDQLYEGSTYFLFEVANHLRLVKHGSGQSH
jgi:nitrogenase molybdenum-iron protein NifN